MGLRYNAWHNFCQVSFYETGKKSFKPLKTAWQKNKIVYLFHIMGIIFTLLALALAFLLKSPARFFAKKILENIGKKNTFFRQNIQEPSEKPFILLSSALVWLALLYCLPHIWKLGGGIPDFLSTPITSILTIFIKVIIGAGLVWWFYNLVDVVVDKAIAGSVFKAGSDSVFQKHFVPFITRFFKILVICFGGLLVLQSLGFNVMSLLAGLGLGGVAIALAAKDSASNILAYVNIMLDRPFSIGDWIQFNDMEGTVVEVGMRSSKIKTFYDSVVSIPNSVLASAHIDNMGKRRARRTRLYLGLEYSTPPDKIKLFTDGIKNILLQNQYVKKDYFQVYFNDFGDSGLKIILNFFLVVPSWEEELKEKQNIYMEILQLAKKLTVNFAFPTRSVHLESTPKDLKI